MRKETEQNQQNQEQKREKNSAGGPTNSACVSRGLNVERLDSSSHTYHLRTEYEKILKLVSWHWKEREVLPEWAVNSFKKLLIGTDDCTLVPEVYIYNPWTIMILGHFGSKTNKQTKFELYMKVCIKNTTVEITHLNPKEFFKISDRNHQLQITDAKERVVKKYKNELRTNKDAAKKATECMELINASCAAETARLQESQQHANPNSILALSPDAIKALPFLQDAQQLQPENHRPSASECQATQQHRGDLRTPPRQLFSSHNRQRQLKEGMQGLTIGAQAVLNPEPPRPSGK